MFSFSNDNWLFFRNVHFSLNSFGFYVNGSIFRKKGEELVFCFSFIFLHLEIWHSAAYFYLN